MDIYTMTSTNLFIRPLLKIPMKILDEFKFENAYIRDEIKGIDYPNSIYMLFHPDKPDKFNEFVEGERKKKNLIDEYDYPNNWIMLVYRYDEKWKEDVELIQRGRFSEVSLAYRKEMPENPGSGATTLMSIQYHIFLKTDYVKGMWYERLRLEFEPQDEVWHHYPEREIFSQEIFNKLK